MDIYEREESLGCLGLGYRMRINADGQAALKSCLSGNAYLLFQDCCSTTDSSGRFFDSQMMPIDGKPARSWNTTSTQHPTVGGSPDLAINRHSLRQILFAGLVDRVHFGSEVVDFTCAGDQVTVQLAGTRKVRADLLVGGDGIASAVRRRLLPSMEHLHTGDSIIYGRTALTPEVRARIDPDLLMGLSIIMSNGYMALFDPMIFRRDLVERISRLAPGSEIDIPNDYIYFCLIGRSQFLEVRSSEGGTATQDELATAITEKTSLWHVSLRYVLAQADSGSLCHKPILSSTLPEPWKTSNTTLMGDSIHAMNVFGGLGANTALADAAALSDLLGQAAAGELPLRNAVSLYEHAMRTRAHQAIESSRLASQRVLVGYDG